MAPFPGLPVLFSCRARSESEERTEARPVPRNADQYGDGRPQAVEELLPHLNQPEGCAAPERALDRTVFRRTVLTFLIYESSRRSRNRFRKWGIGFALREQVGRVVIGQKYLVDRLLLGLLANGHFARGRPWLG